MNRIFTADRSPSSTKPWSETERGGFIDCTLVKMSKLKLARSIKVTGLVRAGGSALANTPYPQAPAPERDPRA